MDPSPDELAGVVDLFGGLSDEELEGAFRDLAARQGRAFDASHFTDAVARATKEYFLVRVEQAGTDLLVPGPTALPSLPDHADDLPHMMDTVPRSIDRSLIRRRVEERLRAEAAGAVAADNRERILTLLDVAYEVDAWGHDTEDLRDRLATVLE